MRVLVINDKRPERDSLVKILQNASCTVEAVMDAKAGAAAVAREPTQVVLFVWPNGGGADTIRQLRAADPTRHIYFVAMLDGVPKAGEVPTVMGAGVHDYIRRPFHPEELVARVQGPVRLLKWARSVAKPAMFDLSRGTDFSKLEAWKRLGPIVAEDLGQVVGESLEASDGWPKPFGQKIWGATISMSMASEQTEVRVSIVVDPTSATWLANTLAGDPAPGDEVLEDVLRELANTAGGAVKRAALPENVILTVGIPANDHAVRGQGDGVRSWMVDVDGGKAKMAIVGEIRRRDNLRVSASKLREGMVLVHDLRNETGALLVAAGSRLTSTTAERVAKALGDRFVVEVACT